MFHITVQLNGRYIYEHELIRLIIPHPHLVCIIVLYLSAPLSMKKNASPFPFSRSEHLVTTEEVVILLVVMLIWLYSCVLFYVR